MPHDPFAPVKLQNQPLITGECPEKLWRRFARKVALVPPQEPLMPGERIPADATLLRLIDVLPDPPLQAFWHSGDWQNPIIEEYHWVWLGAVTTTSAKPKLYMMRDYNKRPYYGMAQKDAYAVLSYQKRPRTLPRLLYPYFVQWDGRGQVRQDCACHLCLNPRHHMTKVLEVPQEHIYIPPSSPTPEPVSAFTLEACVEALDDALAWADRNGHQLDSLSSLMQCPQMMDYQPSIVSQAAVQIGKPHLAS